jgi:RNA polymerase sigma-70 factor (ECF subfamily)
MDANRTTAAIQGYLDELAGLQGQSPAEPVVRMLLGTAAGRLHQLCATMLHRSYPRLTLGPINLESEEMLGAVVERLIKALKNVRPGNVRQFFQIANQHVRWELNEVARHFDQQIQAVEMGGQEPAAPQPSSTQLGPTAQRLLQAIEELPEEEREVFELVKIQGMTHLEAGRVLDISDRTVLRRSNRALLLLSQKLGDLIPMPGPQPEQK